MPSEAAGPVPEQLRPPWSWAWAAPAAKARPSATKAFSSVSGGISSGRYGLGDVPQTMGRSSATKYEADTCGSEKRLNGADSGPCGIDACTRKAASPAAFAMNSTLLSRPLDHLAGVRASDSRTRPAAAMSSGVASLHHPAPAAPLEHLGRQRSCHLGRDHPGATALTVMPFGPSSRGGLGGADHPGLHRSVVADRTCRAGR